MTPKSDFPQPEFWYPHFVSYGETDTMGVLYYAEYLHVFERARSFCCRERDMSYAEMERRGLILPVREAQCRYRAPIRFDDAILVRTGIAEWARASITFHYEIWDREKTVLHATGMTQHACVDGSGKLIRVPGWLRELFS
ncbi:acyl-CoA thioesterase [Pseudodesulfovibrio tunisiensis]|uniref:acyl-CoA thioesterase n=1 Tax=Pseudodesulfovibrio tunisiensis TaxID=463192 RepID=UPI001FB35F09|nr:thioesterase family protein [Pseudodesulfovibrio tunisiensis]